MIAEPTVNVNKKSKIIKRKQMEILELKSTIDEIKISLEGFNNRSEQAEKKSVNLKIRQLELSSMSRKNEEKWIHYKRPVEHRQTQNMHIGISGEKIFEEIKAENSPHLMTNMNLQI